MAESSDFQVLGTNPNALFTLKLHRGDGMLLLAMNWKAAKPPKDFVGFAIEYMEPGGDRFFAIKNRLAFTGTDGAVNPESMSSKLSPIQKFRWIHFPRNANLTGQFTYRVTPVFMNDQEALSYGEEQEAKIALMRDTYPNELNVSFTRGFITSQGFIDRYESAGSLTTLLPPKADDGLTFTPTHPKKEEAYEWMGFEARQEVLDVLDKAIADPIAKVFVVAYDLNEPEVLKRLIALGNRLQIIIDDSSTHGKDESAETQAFEKLKISAGASNVKRQHLGSLQHNKTIVVESPQTKLAVCGSTNFSWRGMYVQNNNAIVLKGATAIQPFLDSFKNYWSAGNSPATFGGTASAKWTDLGFADIKAKISFSPHVASNALLQGIANDVLTTDSSLFFSLAFLSQTPGPIMDAIEVVSNKPDIFVYGISDKEVKGIELQKPNRNAVLVSPEELADNVPEPFKTESSGGFGTRMHHKFLVVDFDKPTARVYMGSYNFSGSADLSNGENLLLIQDQKIATSYMIEALRIFDHYHYRLTQKSAQEANTKLALKKPPVLPDEKPWWDRDYTEAIRIRDRELFA